MIPLNAPPRVDTDPLLRRVDRLLAETQRSAGLSGPTGLLLALTLREQLRQTIAELTADCAAMAAAIAASRLRQTATAAYGAGASTRRTPK